MSVAAFRYFQVKYILKSPRTSYAKYYSVWTTSGQVITEIKMYFFMIQSVLNTYRPQGGSEKNTQPYTMQFLDNTFLKVWRFRRTNIIKIIPCRSKIQHK